MLVQSMTLSVIYSLVRSSRPRHLTWLVGKGTQRRRAHGRLPDSMVFAMPAVLYVKSITEPGPRLGAQC